MSIEKYVCDFCLNSYSSLSSLNYHKKTAKFCTELQQKGNPIKRCAHCKKDYATKQNLQNHLLVCKQKNR